MSRSFLKRFLGGLGLSAAIRRMAARQGYSVLPNEKSPLFVWDWLAAQPIDTILDIGACDGMLARTKFMPLFPKASIHSFEPSPVAFELLKQTTQASGGRIIAHNYGLGETEESLPFTSAKDSLPASSLLDVTDTLLDNFPKAEANEKFSVDIKVLDTVAPTLTPAISGNILVKIDVQGFEDRVINGGKDTISKASICMIEIQIAPLYKGQPDFSDIHRLMTEMGFSLIGVTDQQTDDKGKILYFDALYTKAQKGT